MKPNSKYKWKYVANTNAKAARKAIMFKSMSKPLPKLKCLEFDFSGLEPPVGRSLWLVK